MSHSERLSEQIRAELNEPLTAKALDQWIDRIRDRKLVPDTFWGKIRWSKSLGRPIAPTLASAFVIEHIHWEEEVLDYETGRFIRIISPHVEPSKRDVPDPEYYQVSFMSKYRRGHENRIRVYFS